MRPIKFRARHKKRGVRQRIRASRPVEGEAMTQDDKWMKEARETIEQAYESIKEGDVIISITERGLKKTIAQALKRKEEEARKDEREICAKEADSVKSHSVEFRPDYISHAYYKDVGTVLREGAELNGK